MKKQLLIFLLLLSLQIQAQQLLEWEQHYGANHEERMDAMVQALDGGFVLLGYTSSSDSFDVGTNKGTSDYWLVKTDREGVLLWQQTLGGAGTDEGRDLRATPDGGYILIGSSPSLNGDVGGNNGVYDYWVVKTDGLGMIEWETNLGGTGNDRAWSVTPASDGGYIAFGHTYSENIDIGDNNGSSDYWIVKLDGDGNMLWEQNYGGSATERSRCIDATDDGGYILLGYTDSDDGDVGANNGDEDAWLVKVDAEGELEWEQNYGGSAEETGRVVRQTADGGYIIGGTSKSSDGGIGQNQGGKDIWLFKIDPNGVLEWQQTYGGSLDDIMRDVQETTDGGYVLTGETASSDGDISFNQGARDIWVLKTDANGLLEWEKTLGGTADELSFSIVETEYHSYVIGGYTFSHDGDVSENYGAHDFWLVKIRDCVFPNIANTILMECEAIEGEGRAAFNLSTAFDTLTTDYGLNLKWYTGSNSDGPINNPSAFISGDSSVFLQLSIEGCLSEFLPIHLEVNPIAAPTYLEELICPGDDPIVINEEIFDQSGTYTVTGLTNSYGCDSIVILDLEVISPEDLPVADAGDDQMVSDPIAMLSGNEITAVFGTWSCNTTAEISEEMNATTGVTDLVKGNNIFVWSLDHPLCGFYDSDTVNVVYQQDFFLPNVFTPNGDGSNDLFTIPGLYNNGITRFSFSVFNRSGVLVYEESGFGNDWDGRDLSGEELEEGTYYFVLRGEDVRYEGAVLIVRD